MVDDRRWFFISSRGFIYISLCTVPFSVTAGTYVKYHCFELLYEATAGIRRPFGQTTHQHAFPYLAMTLLSIPLTAFMCKTVIVETDWRH